MPVPGSRGVLGDTLGMGGRAAPAAYRARSAVSGVVRQRGGAAEAAVEKGGGEPPSWAREAAVDVDVDADVDADVAAALEAAGGDTVAGRAPGRDAGGGDGLRTSASSEEADAATRSESMPPTMSSADPDMVTRQAGTPLLWMEVCTTRRADMWEEGAAEPWEERGLSSVRSQGKEHETCKKVHTAQGRGGIRCYICGTIIARLRGGTTGQSWRVECEAVRGFGRSAFLNVDVT